jgi:hypothetical protein
VCEQQSDDVHATTNACVHIGSADKVKAHKRAMVLSRLLTCSRESEFIMSMDVHACSYECLQHRHFPIYRGSFDIAGGNLCACVQQTAG